MTFYLTCSQIHYRCAVLMDVTIVKGGFVSAASNRTLASRQQAMTARIHLYVAAGTVKCVL